MSRPSPVRHDAGTEAPPSQAETLRSLAACTMVPVVEVGPESTITFLNAPAASFLGVPGDMAAGSPVDHFLGGLDAPRERAWVEVRRPDGARFPAGMRSIAAGESRFLILADRRRHPRMLSPAAQAERRLIVAGRVAEGVAHDLANLLTVIGGSASLLGLEREGHGAGEVEAIQSAVRQARDLLDRLSVSLRGEGDRHVVGFDLARTVAATLPVLERVAGPRLDVSVEPSEAPVLVDGDPARVNEILLNLAVNAREAVLAGQGRLTIQVLAGTEERGVPPRLVVRDDGAGVRAGMLEQLQEGGGVSTKSLYRGLGLSLCHDAARSLGGRLLLDSEEGVGTTVTVELPRPEGRFRAPA